MIMKQYDKFVDIKILEALEGRIMSHHPKKEMIIRDLRGKNQRWPARKN